MKKITNIIFSRLVFVALCLVVQAATIVYILVLFREHFIWFYGLCLLVALAMLLYIVNSELNPAYKIAWLMPMMILPVFGALLYLMFGVNLRSKDQQQRMTEMHRQYRQAMAELPSPLLALRQQNPDGALQATYLQHLGTPLFQHTSSQFLHIGEVMYAKMLEDLRKAEKFIFMEYFIIEEGKMWNEILDILTQKAKAGVDVRLIYDDIGCMFTLDKNYYRKLEALGIKTWVFGRFIPVLATRFNNRNHRKICVIDGQIGYTGGINLADEYINVYEKHGHWLDCGIRLEGAAVWSFTVMFLSMWDYLHRIKEDFQFFAPNSQLTAEIANDGYVQPFTDMPFDDERVGETVYLNIVGRARKYLYISTPYLVVDHEMSTALQLAAKSGVDVRIITPHIPDKKLVFAITRSYYQELVEAGVRIYEYLPGFIHSKTFVCDDACAVVGTINLDFR
ncbi:MAG: cardiolipin synthase, partial [Clostridiales bacterium]